MHYISTRGHAPILDFNDVLLAGLAVDGGLYVPQQWPVFTATELGELRGLSYAELAVQILTRFIGDRIPLHILQTLTKETYRRFDHRAVTPLVQIDTQLWLLELFHGPTLAFKDLALQLVGRLFDYVVQDEDKPLTIIAATSGDTGPAAIEAFRERRRVDIVILYPKDRVSPLQRRQMTTVFSDNVHILAVEGSFDDCQALVKGVFNDPEVRCAYRLSAANSINWARIMCQIVYYVAAGVALGAPHRAVSFVVPTGNFGNIYAAYAAYRMGLPIDRLIIASNENDTLPRFFSSGLLQPHSVVPTISPSIDIAISSNFERFLFEVWKRDSTSMVTAMQTLEKEGTLSVSTEQLEQARKIFTAYRIDQATVRQTIAETWAQSHTLIDPHSAVGVAAAYTEPERRNPKASPLIAMGCAHPAKFPETVTAAVGFNLPLPTFLSDIYQRPERFTVVPNDSYGLNRLSW